MPLILRHRKVKKYTTGNQGNRSR